MPEPAPRLAGGRRAKASTSPRPRFCRRHLPGARRAFTLLEILVVIALIAMVTGALITGTARLLQHRTPTASEFFWKAVDGARREAMMANCDVRLSFDPKGRQFVAVSSLGDTQTFPFAPDLLVDLGFLAPISDAGAQAKSMPFVTFYGDGTCSPFSAVFSGKGFDGSVVEIDPWTCAPILRSAPSS